MLGIAGETILPRSDPKIRLRKAIGGQHVQFNDPPLLELMGDINPGTSTAITKRNESCWDTYIMITAFTAQLV